MDRTSASEAGNGSSNLPEGTNKINRTDVCPIYFIVRRFELGRGSGKREFSRDGVHEPKGS